MKQFSYPFLVFLLLAIPMISQGQNLYAMDNSPIRDCSGFFLDSGGNFNSYGPNEILESQICPDNTTGTHAVLIFYNIDLGMGEIVCFYDGPDSLAPLIACASDFAPGESFIIRAPAVNPTGCITVAFQSDASDQGVGWYAEMDCSRSQTDAEYAKALGLKT